MLNALEIAESNTYPIRKIGQKLGVGWTKQLQTGGNFFTLDQSALNGSDVLGYDADRPFNPAHAYQLTDVSAYVKHAHLERGVEFPYAVQSAVADFQLVNHNRQYSGTPYVYPSRPLRWWGGLASQHTELSFGGNAYQKTYSGEQMLPKRGLATPSNDSAFWSALNVVFTPGEDGWGNFAFNPNQTYQNLFIKKGMVAFGSQATFIFEIKNAQVLDSPWTVTVSQYYRTDQPFDGAPVAIAGSGDVNAAYNSNSGSVYFSLDNTGATGAAVFVANIRSSYTANDVRAYLSGSGIGAGCSADIRLTILDGNHISDWQDYIGENWQPYTGGIPAPNPDYPQEIQTATGTQTVGLPNGDTMTLMLDALSLAKVGTYQDRIFKNVAGSPYHTSSVAEGAWAVRKETGTIATANTYFSNAECSNIAYVRTLKATDSVNYGTYSSSYPVICTLASPVRSGVVDIATNIGTIRSDASTTNYWIGLPKATTSAEATALLSGGSIRYILATPTTTAITDATLLSQLDAIYNAIVPTAAQATATATTDNMPVSITLSNTSSTTPTLMPLFEGFTSGTTYTGKYEEQADITAMDLLATICDQDLPNMFMATDLRTDQIIRSILVDELGVEDYLLDLDEGDVVIPFVWYEAGKDVGNALKDVVQAENGRLWVDENGIIRFAKQGLNELTTPAVATFDSSNIITAKTAGADRIVNECHIECDIREVQPRQLIYAEENESGYQQTADNDSYRIAKNTTSTFWVQLEDPATAVDTPLIRTARSDVASYFVAVKVSDGVATSSGLAIDEFTTFGDRVMLKIANTNNFALSIREIKLWGTPARVVQTVDFRAKDKESIENYGRKLLEITENPLWGSAENVRDYARKMVQLGASYDQALTLEVRSNLLLQVGDVVEVILPGWSEAKRFAVESISLGIDSPTNCAIKQTLSLVATADEEE